MRPMLAAILMAGTALPAMASSEAAWEQFANDVRTACVAAATPLIEEPHALVDPHGSEHFGLALMRGKAKGAETEIAVICVYDKAAKTAEVGGELPTGEMTP